MPDMNLLEVPGFAIGTFNPGIYGSVWGISSPSLSVDGEYLVFETVCPDSPTGGASTRFAFGSFPITVDDPVLKLVAEDAYVEWSTTALSGGTTLRTSKAIYPPFEFSTQGSGMIRQINTAGVDAWQFGITFPLDLAENGSGLTEFSLPVETDTQYTSGGPMTARFYLKLIATTEGGGGGGGSCFWKDLVGVTEDCAAAFSMWSGTNSDFILTMLLQPTPASGSNTIDASAVGVDDTVIFNVSDTTVAYVEFASLTLRRKPRNRIDAEEDFEDLGSLALPTPSDITPSGWSSNGALRGLFSAELLDLPALDPAYQYSLAFTVDLYDSGDVLLGQDTFDAWIFDSAVDSAIVGPANTTVLVNTTPGSPEDERPLYLYRSIVQSLGDASGMSDWVTTLQYKGVGYTTCSSPLVDLTIGDYTIPETPVSCS